VSVLFVFVMPAFAAPAITWSPGTVSISLLQGTQNLVTISFASTKDLRNIDVLVSRKVRPFVSVNPSHFDAVPKNIPITLTLAFSSAENALAREYKGNVRLRGGNNNDDDDEDGDGSSPGLPVDLVVNVPSSTIIPNGISVPSVDRFASDPGTGLHFAKDEIIIGVRPDATQQQIVSAAALIGASFLGHDETVGAYQLFLPVDTLDEALTLIVQLEVDPVIRYAVPHFFGSVASTIPNDPSWNLGGSDASRLFKSWSQTLVHLPEAWDMTTGNLQSKVAFVDVGFDFKHEDFVINGPLSDCGSNYDAFRDHGTEVASIAAAVGNNSRGIAGVMWSTNLLLFSCSANLDSFVDFPTCRQLTTEAIDRGARVINVSLSEDFSQVCNPSRSATDLQTLFDREKKAWADIVSHGVGTSGGILFIFGAGNDRITFDSAVPSALSKDFSNVVSVGAVDRHGNEASYSNYGVLSLWAPGGDQATSMCPNRQRSSPWSLTEIPFYPATKIWTAQPNNAYDYSNPGTSLAAPFVTGVAGLMLSANPNVTAAQIKNIIVTTADDTGKLDPSGNPIKILNAFRAVQQALAPPSQVSFARTDLPAGTQPRAVAVADFNRDGNLDVVATNWVTWNASVLLGNGNGSFQTAINSAVVPANYESVAVGDFNGDGKPDLVAAQGFSASAVTVWLGNGDGTYPAGSIASTGGKPISVATGDFNGDGKTDVVSANIDTSTVSLLLGNGNGGFQAPMNFAVGTAPHSIAVADFDRNGTLDVATANYGSNDISILLNNGNGTFRTAVNMGAGTLPYAVAVGDFNNDGKLDLAVANWGSNNVSVFLGNGNGTFQGAQIFAAGSSPSSVVVGDFNADGKLDLAVANTNSNNVSILLGNGDGTFQVPQNFGVGLTPALIAVGDFNKDGRPDLVVGYYGSNQVTILINTP
jgi:hypothetical protein